MATLEQDTTEGSYGYQRPRWLLAVLGVVCAIALLGAGAALTVLTGVGTDKAPAVDSVDAGFARAVAASTTSARSTGSGWRAIGSFADDALYTGLAVEPH